MGSFTFEKDMEPIGSALPAPQATAPGSNSPELAPDLGGRPTVLRGSVLWDPHAP